MLKAIEKVFASFYNDNAWLERLRFGIKESTVGMAILVHENAPDPDEMANGVATIKRSRFNSSIEFQFNLVTQLGAVSVTNPEGGAKPEVVEGGQSNPDGDPFLQTQQPTAPRAPKRLEARPEGDDFHAMMRYVRTFT